MSNPRLTHPAGLRLVSSVNSDLAVADPDALDPETEARALLIAGGDAISNWSLSGLPVEYGEHDDDRESEEILLAADEWEVIAEQQLAHDDSFDAAVRSENLRRLRGHLERVRTQCPDDYKLLSMYWGLDGECVSTIAAIAQKLRLDRDQVEAAARRLLTDLQMRMGVERPGEFDLRIEFAPTVLPAATQRRDHLLAA